jgi:hypothetical protein
MVSDIRQTEAKPCFSVFARFVESSIGDYGVLMIGGSVTEERILPIILQFNKEPRLGCWLNGLKTPKNLTLVRTSAT